MKLRLISHTIDYGPANEYNFILTLRIEVAMKPEFYGPFQEAG